jgi:hypothetical protein
MVTPSDLGGAFFFAPGWAAADWGGLGVGALLGVLGLGAGFSWGLSLGDGFVSRSFWAISGDIALRRTLSLNLSTCVTRLPYQQGQRFLIQSTLVNRDFFKRDFALNGTFSVRFGFAPKICLF